MVISVGLLLLVAGEVEFDLVGFILVMTASALAGLRWTITQVLLQGSSTHGAAGGPVEVILQLTPVMSLVLAVVSLAHERLWSTLPGSPYFASFGHSMLTVLIIVAGGLLAFVMVWAEFALISHTSALTFMVAGTFKEIVTVAAAVLFLGETFTAVNALGLVVLIAGVALFNWQKYRKLREQERARLSDVLEDGVEAGAAAEDERVRLVSSRPSKLRDGGRAADARLFVLQDDEDDSDSLSAGEAGRDAQSGVASLATGEAPSAARGPPRAIRTAGPRDPVQILQHEGSTLGTISSPSKRSVSSPASSMRLL